MLASEQGGRRLALPPLALPPVGPAVAAMSAAADEAPTCIICCESQAEQPDAPLVSTGCACSRQGSSAGRAHLLCIAAAAEHNADRWTTCPTCKQVWSGTFEIDLSRKRCESFNHLPADDPERLVAKLNLAATLNKNDAPGAREDATRIYEEGLETWRRTLGVRHERTLVVMANLSMTYEDAGNTEAALALADESLEILRQGRLGSGQQVGEDSDEEEEDVAALEMRMDLMARTLGTASRLYGTMGSHAAARPLMEAAVELSKKAGDDGNRVHELSNLGVCLGNIGDIYGGRQVRKEAVMWSRRALGAAHPRTVAVVDALRDSEETSISNGESDVQSARAIGRLVGLTTVGLNGALVFVLGYAAEKGRYKVTTRGAGGTRPLGIKPENVVLKSGSAVLVAKPMGLALPPALAEYEGTRCIITDFDGERTEEGAQTGQGEYAAALCWSAEDGNGRTLRLPLGCCLLESLASELQTPEPPPPVSAQPSFRDLPQGVSTGAVVGLATELGLPTEGISLLRRMSAGAVVDDLPEEEEAELDGGAVTAMGCGKMVPLEDDY